MKLYFLCVVTWLFIRLPFLYLFPLLTYALLLFSFFQMLIALTVAVDALKPVVPCSLLSLSMVPFASCSIIIGGISWLVPNTLAQRLDNLLYKSYMRLCLFVFENLSGVEVRFMLE